MYVVHVRCVQCVWNILNVCSVDLTVFGLSGLDLQSVGCSKLSLKTIKRWQLLYVRCLTVIGSWWQSQVIYQFIEYRQVWPHTYVWYNCMSYYAAGPFIDRHRQCEMIHSCHSIAELAHLYTCKNVTRREITCTSFSSCLQKSLLVERGQRLLLFVLFHMAHIILNDDAIKNKECELTHLVNILSFFT